MLTLAATNTISGDADAATSITYTIMGDEISAGADAFKVLAQGQLPSSIGTLYTVPASTMALVRSIHLANPTAGAVTAQLNVNGTSAATQILPPATIVAGGFAVYGGERWTFYNSQGQALGVGAAGAAGADGDDGDDGAPGAPGDETIIVREVGGSDIVDVAELEFDASDFVVTDETGGVARVALTAPGGGGGADDPIADVFGAADTDFDGTSLTGLTTLGAPDILDADTTIPGHLFIKEAAAAGPAHHGVYAAIPGAYPWTAIAKISDATFFAADFVRLGCMFLTVASPGALETFQIVHNAGWKLASQAWTNSTTFSASVGTDVLVTGADLPIYYAIRGNTATSFDYYYSIGGRVWFRHSAARNPGITVANIGVALVSHSAVHAMGLAVDFLRIWTSSKTFPGA